MSRCLLNSLKRMPPEPAAARPQKFEQLFHPEDIISGFITLDGSVGQGLTKTLKAFKISISLFPASQIAIYILNH